MSIIFLLIGISLTVALCFLGAFLWANNSGQYDDTYTPSIRMLFDDDDAAAVAVVPEGKPVTPRSHAD